MKISDLREYDNVLHREILVHTSGMIIDVC